MKKPLFLCASILVLFQACTHGTFPENSTMRQLTLEQNPFRIEFSYPGTQLDYGDDFRIDFRFAIPPGYLLSLPDINTGREDLLRETVHVDEKSGHITLVPYSGGEYILPAFTVVITRISDGHIHNLSAGPIIFSVSMPALSGAKDSESAWENFHVPPDIYSPGRIPGLLIVSIILLFAAAAAVTGFLDRRALARFADRHVSRESVFRKQCEQFRRHYYLPGSGELKIRAGYLLDIMRSFCTQTGGQEMDNLCRELEKLCYSPAGNTTDADEKRFRAIFRTFISRVSGKEEDEEQ